MVLYNLHSVFISDIKCELVSHVAVFIIRHGVHTVVIGERFLRNEYWARSNVVYRQESILQRNAGSIRRCVASNNSEDVQSVSYFRSRFSYLNE